MMIAFMVLVFFYVVGILASRKMNDGEATAVCVLFPPAGVMFGFATVVSFLIWGFNKIRMWALAVAYILSIMVNKK